MPDRFTALKAQRDALIDEVDRLTRIVNGYDRTPAEQRAAGGEAEVDSLRAGNGQLRGDLERLRAENENLRGGHEVYYPLAMRTLAAEAEAERLRTENAGLREADLRSRAEQHALAVDVVHVAADCPVCRYALGLAEPTSAAVGPWTGPVAANRPRDGWMRHTEAGDVADATTTIEPDVSGFEDQS